MRTVKFILLSAAFSAARKGGFSLNITKIVYIIYIPLIDFYNFECYNSLRARLKIS